MARPLTGVGTAIAEAFATGPLRRVQASWVASAVGTWVFFVALAVYAYDAGGAVAVGVAALVRMAPAGLAAPLTGLLVDRRSRRDVLLASLVVRALVLIAIAAAVTAGAPFAVVLALAAVFTIASTAHRPAQAALLPGLVDTPRQLGACNAIWSGLDNGGFLVGSLIGGVLIATAGVDVAFAVTALLFAVAALPVVGIPRDAVPEHREGQAGTGAVAELLSGFRAVAADKPLRLVVGFVTATIVVEGIVDVLIVVVALELLDLPSAGVGWLNACWGAGGFLAGFAALVLLGRGHLARGLAAGGTMVGLALIGIAALASPVAAGVLLAVLGVGYGLIEAAGLSLLQRLSSDDVLGRAFAVFESSYWLATGVGAMIAPALVALLGVRGALVATGACLPLLVVLRSAALARLEAGMPVPERAFRALRAVPAFGPLALATVENVSRRVTELRVDAGEVVIREGDSGDRLYVIAEGAAAIERGGAHVGERGPGDFFGEIALLRDIPRTATVTALTDSVLFALDRDAFQLAISSHPRSADAVRVAGDARFELAAQT